MDSYEIIMTEDATADLFGLRDYIVCVLCAPDTALAYIKIIRSEIDKLSKAPKIHKIVSEEPWNSREIRRMNVRNFAIFYKILEDERRVYILNIIYKKRDLSNVLLDLE